MTSDQARAFPPADAASGEGAGQPARPLVDVRDVSKRFGGVQAVSHLSLALWPGQVHGLVGENGAGKSTLAKLIGGLYQPDEGEILVDGQPVRFRAPRDALSHGIATIAQELALVPARSVSENVFLGVESKRLGIVDAAAMRQRFDRLNAATGFGLDPAARVGALRVAERQKVEILRAIARDARLILMDEPTASLTADETDRLLAIVRRLSASGTAIVLVSHFLDEVLAVSDTVTVMRDGRRVRTAPASSETHASLVAAMIGHGIDWEFPLRPPDPDGNPVVLEARGLSRRRAIADVSFTIRAGEILGLAGLVGSGRTEIARAIFGADRIDAGEIRIDGRPVRVTSPRAAADAGIAMLPESRKEQGLVMTRSVRENATLADLPAFAVSGVVNVRRERAAAGREARRLDVKTPSLEAPVLNLSGGNQQKVLFAKWLLRRPRVLVADEPTRGVDVGAKRQIHELLVELAAQGMAVLLISSEIEEVLGLSHRILVLRAGRIVREFDGATATKDDVMAAAFQTTRAKAGGAEA